MILFQYLEHAHVREPAREPPAQRHSQPIWSGTLAALWDAADLVQQRFDQGAVNCTHAPNMSNRLDFNNGPNEPSNWYSCTSHPPGLVPQRVTVPSY